ncbi:nucleotide/sugar transporter family protein [Tanacetum coccineum]|uniref:Nucleotide/sugar transporter family protein n=1 Tax=Tanacetum coccineum TaxID=301880 RepID=A0ABQ4YX19_9ASTR
MSSSSSSSSSDRMSLPLSDPSSQRGGEQRLFKGSTMTSRGAYAALSYMSCAVMLVLFNKAALSSYSFPSANVITLFQMICSCSFLFVLRRWKLISFSSGDADNSTRFVSLQTLIHTSPLALTYLLYMLATMESVRGVNVPMYTTLRRTTVVFTMFVEFILVGQKYSRSVIGSVLLIVFGAFVAGSRDLSFDAYGYSIVFLSNITTAIYLATISRIGNTSGLNSFGLMWCNGEHKDSKIILALHNYDDSSLLSYARACLPFIDLIQNNFGTGLCLLAKINQHLYCITSVLHACFSLKLLDLPEHNSQFSGHADHLCLNLPVCRIFFTTQL